MEGQRPIDGRMRPGRPRLLIVTGIYPTADQPVAGIYVQQRVDQLVATGAEVHLVHAMTYRGSVVARYLGLAARALTATGQFDGVEAHVLLPAGAIGLMAAMVRRLPLVVVAHGSDVSYTARRHMLLTKLARLVIRRAAAVVANSQATADLVAELGGEAAVISPGVDFLRFSPGPSERSGLNLPEGRIAMFVGPVDAHKGVDVFSDGVTRAGWNGLIVGNGHQPADDRFQVRPQMPPLELCRYYRSVDCVVIPSRREGLGLVAIEAVACGIPIVATRVGGLPEVLVEGLNGVALDPATGPGLALALAAVAARPWDVDRMRESVRSHDLRTATEAMDAVWRGVIRGY
jgi:glycosyltransferase involved in cell wall biosynthesis